MIAIFSLLLAKGECSSANLYDRMYVQPTDIALRGSELWIQLENQWVQVSH